jgi:hypothetical protein
MDSSRSQMRRQGGSVPSRRRAVIAVLALYALLLQAFLGGLMPVPASADGLCAQHSDSAPPLGKAVPHGHGACCTAAQAAGPALPPRTATIPVAWEEGFRAKPAWTAIELRRARAPPGVTSAPRGPPSA